MERIWLKSYPPGVPADIDPDEYQSLVELFDSGIAKYAKRPAFTNMGKTITFAELEKCSRDFAAWLKEPEAAQILDSCEIEVRVVAPVVHDPLRIGVRKPYARAGAELEGQLRHRAGSYAPVRRSLYLDSESKKS